MCCNNNGNRSSCGCDNDRSASRCGCGCGNDHAASRCGGGCGNDRAVSRCGCGESTFPDWPCGCSHEQEMEFPVYVSIPATMARGSANFSAFVEREEPCGCGRG